jgi:hypothetical protein
MSLLDGLFQAGETIGGLIPYVGPLVSAGFGAWKGAYDSSVTSQSNKDIQAREDSSVQRKVADLKAAGLAPQLAAGGGEPSSQPIRIDESGGVEQGVEDSERAQAAQLAAAATLMESTNKIHQSSAEAAMAQDKFARGQQVALDEEGNVRFNPNNGVPYSMNDWNDILDQRLKEANAKRGIGMYDANEERAALLKSGLTEQQADNVMAEIEAREMAKSEPFFAPRISKGTLGGAALDLGKGLVGIAGHAALGAIR